MALPFGSQLGLPVGFGSSAWRCHSVFRRSVWLAELAAPRSQRSAASRLTMGLVAQTPWRRNQVLSMALPFGAQHGTAIGIQYPALLALFCCCCCARVQQWLLAPRRLHYFGFGGFMFFLQATTKPVWP